MMRYPDVWHWRQLKIVKISLKPLPGNGLKRMSGRKGIRLNIKLYMGNYSVKAAIKRWRTRV